jgi:hypothetical protein
VEVILFAYLFNTVHFSVKDEFISTYKKIIFPPSPNFYAKKLNVDKIHYTTVYEDLLIRPLSTGTWEEQWSIAMIAPVYVLVGDYFVDSYIHGLVHVFVIRVPRTVTGTGVVNPAIRSSVTEEETDKGKLGR